MSSLLDLAERVVLVDERDTEIGIGAKLETHHSGMLHRAFSIFLFDSDGKTLIQKRAAHKYHSGGKWANSCCGHPRPAENITKAAERRLQEELGMIESLEFGFLARYRAELDGEMIENEIVHVHAGRVASQPVPNPEEASDVMLVSLEGLRDGSELPIDAQTAWLRHYLDHHFEDLLTLRNGYRN